MTNTSSMFSQPRKMDKVGPETPAGPPSHSKVATPETLFDRWCEQTDVHGVSEFHDAKAVVAKGFWLAVVILGCSLAVNQSIELLLNYVMEDSWVTTMSTESAPGGQMRWPDIEICKITPTDLWMPGLERRGLTDPYDVAFVDYETRAGVLFYDQFQAEVPLTEAGINSTEQEYKDRLNCTEPYPYCLQDRLSCDDIVLDCGGGAGRVDVFVYCDCSKYASESEQPECFKVNATALLSDKPPPNGNMVGYRSGIYLLLNPRIYQTYPYLLLDDFLPPAGLRVEIHSEQETQKGATSPIFLWPGGQMVIAMTAEKRRIKARTRRSLPFQNTEMPCVSKGEYKWFKTDVPSRELCQNDCFVEFCSQLANCTVDVNSALARSHQIENPCSGQQKRNCTLARTELNGQLPSGFNVTRCESSCKEPCETDFISIKLTTAQFPAPTKLASFATFLNRAYSSADTNRSRNLNFTKEEIEQLILLNIFYESNEYRVIEKVNRASADELVSNIGGVLGVWTGMSMITILQAFLYACRGLEHLLRRFFRCFRDRCWRAAELR